MSTASIETARDPVSPQVMVQPADGEIETETFKFELTDFGTSYKATLQPTAVACACNCAGFCACGLCSCNCACSSSCHCG